ncbi:MAG TPA: ABC transporter permease [Puia sp.]|nr:ABC transporter permease [Puia sp.]
MLRNYLKIAFRNMAKYKVISFINLFGLTVGITCCLLILTYIIHETSYDKYNSKADRIYRVTRAFYNKEGIQSLHLGAVAPPYGPLLKNEFPDIEKVTRILPFGTVPTRYKEKIFNEKDIYCADEYFSGVFDVAMVKGDPHTALTDPFSIIVTDDVARRYFGDEDPMGKTIQMNSQFNLKVTGIFKPFPENAHFHPHILISFNTLKDTAIYGEKGLQTNWGNNSFFTYLLLPKDYPAKNIEARFPAFLDKYMPGYYGTLPASKMTRLYLQKLTDIHLTSHLDEEMEENGDIKRIWVFSAIALFILFIACINYMNLSTARSALRAKEIGIRKTSGAQRSEIIIQFLSESVMITAMATILAVGLTWLTLPLLNTVTGLSLSIGSVFIPQVIIPLILTPFIIGIISGIYPALFMSSFQPIKVLKGLFKAGKNTIIFREALVVVQFGISIVLIICTAVVFQQLHYMQEKSLGFDKERIVTIGYDEATMSKSYESFRNELRNSAYIKDVGRSSRIPSGRLLDEQGASTESGDSLRPVSADIKYVAADFDFIPTYGMHVLAGRSFSRAYGTDTTSFVLNAAGARALGLQQPQQAVGRNFSYGGVKGKIVGVLEDFHFESLHQQIVPLVLAMTPPGTPGFHYNWVSIKIAGNNVPAGVAFLEKTWKKYMPGTPFEYTFLDDKFDELYRSEQRQGTLFTSFAGIAIFIACLGLLGLSAFAISQRIKEIGIRKVLGANVRGIVTLLSKDFLILVGIAAAIAFPAAWIVMHNWLKDFAYRISIPWWIFPVAGILASAVALITISFQAIRAATAPPVKSLRTE